MNGKYYGKSVLPSYLLTWSCSQPYMCWYCLFTKPITLVCRWYSSVVKVHKKIYISQPWYEWTVIMQSLSSHVTIEWPAISRPPPRHNSTSPKSFVLWEPQQWPCCLFIQCYHGTAAISRLSPKYNSADSELCFQRTEQWLCSVSSLVSTKLPAISRLFPKYNYWPKELCPNQHCLWSLSLPQQHHH